MLKKSRPPCFWSKNMTPLVFFGSLLPGPDSMGFVWGGVGRAMMQLMQLLVFFAMLPVLATSVTLCYRL